MNNGKLICTADGTHKPRTLGTYTADPEMFVIVSRQPTMGAGATHYVLGQPGLERLRFRCPSCPRDMQFRSEHVLAFLAADLPSGATRRDLSKLEKAS